MKRYHRRNALDALLKELETILAPLMPQVFSDGFVMEPDFRDLVIPSPSSVVMEAAIDSVRDNVIRRELAESARRLEADMTNFNCNKRRFFEECDDMEVAEKRQADGTLSDTPEALKQLRRNLKGDIVRLKEIINGKAEAQTPIPVVLVGGQAEQLASSAQAKTLIEAHIIPRPSDYQVHQGTLSQWLAKANVSITVRQIQRWEVYLKTDGKKGTKPPDGYTLQTRMTTVSAEAWVRHYATQEKGKLTTRNFFNERTATRDGKPAKPEKTKEAT